MKTYGNINTLCSLGKLICKLRMVKEVLIKLTDESCMLNFKIFCHKLLLQSVGQKGDSTFFSQLWRDHTAHHSYNFKF